MAKKRVGSKKKIEKVKSQSKTLNKIKTPLKKQIFPIKEKNHRIFQILNYMLFSLVISLISFILFKIIDVLFFQNLFYLLTIISFFVSIGFLISLLIYLMISFFKKVHL
ncbi:hypothetical protein GYA25_01840 [Candidatus Woesearchaeota archaeon]|nr:hypothetical protein [Candidatus Woesearchaeota archaeon]